MNKLNFEEYQIKK